MKLINVPALKFSIDQQHGSRSDDFLNLESDETVLLYEQLAIRKMGEVRFSNMKFKDNVPCMQ